MAKSFKCKFITLGTFWFISMLILLFSTIFLVLIMQGQATSQAVLSKDNEDLWAYIPGRSKVEIFQKLLFYSLENPSKILFSNNNENFTVDEKGPFSAKEYTEMLNIKYNETSESVGYNLYRYLNSTDKDYENQRSTILDILNPVGLNFFC